MTMLEAARTRLSGWQRAAIAVGSAVGSIHNPGRADLIAAMAETTSKSAFKRVLERMKTTPEGRAILLERPRIISSNIEHIWDLPPNTFGGAYASFMRSRNFSADDRTPVRFLPDDELSYVVTRSREAHDLWHTLFGLNTNLIGETSLKLIEFMQMQLPMAFIMVGGSLTLLLNEKQSKLFYGHYFPWAFQAGLQSTDLMSVYYEKHFHEDIDDVRRKWGIVPAPLPPKSNQL
ncbi:hypothetical protein Leryth_022492 [Lithospermum erythrorhizon]|nr:hypothetical protein Leryth_022492 [Lithospermum erythrorhizon]